MIETTRFLRSTTLFLTLFLVASAAWAQSARPVMGGKVQPLPSKWPAVNDTTYRLRFPDTWTVDQSGMFGSRFFLFAPLDTAGDTFRENVNLMMNDMRAYPQATLEYLADGAKQQIEQLITDAKVHEFRIAYNGDDKYYLMEYTGKQGQFNLHWKQLYVLANGTFYVLTFTAEESQYTRYLPLAERMFASFALK
jgi:serine/threonine-protein kinase